MLISNDCTFQQFLSIVDGAAAIEHRQCAFAEDVIKAALAGIEQLVHFRLREDFQLAFGRNQGIDNVMFHDAKSYSDSSVSSGAAPPIYDKWQIVCTGIINTNDTTLQAGYQKVRQKRFVD
jgi:hypothetical protein